MSTLPTPTPPPPPSQKKKEEEEDSLTSDIAILDRLHRRNKNQHHSSKWYKWFLILRRNLKKLVVAKDQVEARLRFMRRVVVPSCYVAFSTVVANKRFAPLGVVLVGILASVHQFIGPEPGECIAEKVKVKEVVAIEEDGEDGEEEGVGVGNVWALDQYALGLEDLGESISRRPGGDDGGDCDWGMGGGARRDEDVGGGLTPEERALGSAGGVGPAVVIPEEAVVTAAADLESSSSSSKKRRRKNKELGDAPPPRNTPSHPPEPSLLSLPTIPKPPPPKSLPPPSSSHQKPEKKRKVNDSTLREPRNRQKKQKKRDEIDELFSGIL